MLLGPTDYARYRKVSTNAVKYAIRTGRIKRNEQGLIDPEQADRDWQDNTDESRRIGRPRKARSAADNMKAGATSKATWEAKAKAAAPTIEVAAGEGKPAATVQPTYNESRALKEYYDAEMRRLDFEAKKKTLVPRSEVEDAARNLYRVFRDAMLNVPNRIASQIAAETDAGVVHELLFSEIRQTLEDFANNRKVAA